MSMQFNPEFPLSDQAYDLIVILHEKSKAVSAYNKYIEDVQADTQLRQALIEIRHEDQRHIDMLKGHLARLLSQPVDQSSMLPANPPVPWERAGKVLE